MSSVNKVMLVGRLGQEPELSQTRSGQTRVKLRVATNHWRRVGDDAYEEETEWHNVVVWGRQAEACEKYLSTGSQVFVEGRLEHREFTGRDGERKFYTQVNARDVQFLGGGRQRSEPARAA
jgi:single-strand DNA-binding protein